MLWRLASLPNWTLRKLIFTSWTLRKLISIRSWTLSKLSSLSWTSWMIWLDDYQTITQFPSIEIGKEKNHSFFFIKRYFFCCDLKFHTDYFAKLSKSNVKIKKKNKKLIKVVIVKK